MATNGILLGSLSMNNTSFSPILSNESGLYVTRYYSGQTPITLTFNTSGWIMVTSRNDFYDDRLYIDSVQIIPYSYSDNRRYYYKKSSFYVTKGSHTFTWKTDNDNNTNGPDFYFSYYVLPNYGLIQ